MSEDLVISTDREPFEWVELDQPLCANTYGVAPCAAAIGTTGEEKCYNTRASCQDAQNYDGSEILTLSFCGNRGFIPDDRYYLPYLESATIAPAKINPAGGQKSQTALGIRGSLSVTLADHPHTDRLVDPYLSDRSFDPFERSTFWSKWRARNPYYLNRVIRHKSGFIDPATREVDPATLITRTFFTTGFSGFNSGDTVSISAKDVLTLAFDDKAKAPFASTGKLATGLNEIVTSLTLTPSGVGDLEYNLPTPFFIRVGREVMQVNSRSGDVLNMTRGVYNTSGAEHDQASVVQLCLEYDSVSPSDILFDLLSNYADIPAQYLDKTQWDQEQLEYLPRLYTTLITEPVGVTTLVAEMCEQMYFTTFWNEREALLKLRAIRPNNEDDSIFDLNDAAHLLEDSVQWVDQPDQLITQVWVYYAQIDPTEKLNERRNFGALDITADPESEQASRNNTKKIKTIYSRWMSPADGAAAIDLGEKLLERYQNIPRMVSFSVDAKDREIWLADFINIQNRHQVDFQGIQTPVNMQIVSAQEEIQGTRFKYSAIEYSGKTIGSEPEELLVVIGANIVNANLRELYDDRYGQAPVAGDKIRFIVSPNIVVGGAAVFTGSGDQKIGQYNYSGQNRYRGDSNQNFNVLTENGTYPYYTRQGLTAARDYNPDDDYLSPVDGGGSTGFKVLTTVKERPIIPALVTGDWPAGVELFLDIAAGAKIVGSAGAGSAGGLTSNIYGTSGTSPANWYRGGVRGGDGGNAITATVPITIDNQGLIAGGGGGGGMGGYFGENGIVFYHVNRITTGGGGGAGFGNFTIFPTTQVNGGSVNFSLGQLAVQAKDQIRNASDGSLEAAGVGGQIRYDVLGFVNSGTLGPIPYDFDERWQGGAGGELGNVGFAPEVIITGSSQISQTGQWPAVYPYGGGLGGKSVIGFNNVTWLNYGTVKGSTQA